MYMSRAEKVLHLCNIKGKGLEIGPSFAPIAPKSEGFDIEIIDHLDKEGLKKKYSGHNVDLSKIEEVDYIWNGEKYADLTGKDNYYDYIIASHVIEHTCDIIGFLNDCNDLLKDGGILSLVIPDKRFCFDCMRPLTGVSKAIDCHLNKHTVHSPGTVADHFLNASLNNGSHSWGDAPIGALSLAHTYSDAKKIIDLSQTQSFYIDAHSWVFTKNSFILLIHDLNYLGFIKFDILKTFDDDSYEFFVVLKKCNNIPIIENNLRLELLKKIFFEYTTEIPNSMRKLNMSEEEIVHLLKQNESLYAENVQLKLEKDNFFNSTSWKITQPLRVIKKYLYDKIIN